jgi:hypothetical protein
VTSLTILPFVVRFIFYKSVLGYEEDDNSLIPLVLLHHLEEEFTITRKRWKEENEEARVRKENNMEFHARWEEHGENHFSTTFPSVREMSEEQFRTFLLEAEIPKTCEHFHALALPRRSRNGMPYATPLLERFCLYLEDILCTLLDERRLDLAAILMQNRLPFDLYTSPAAGVGTWIDDSHIFLFDLFFAQGYTLQDLKGQVERKIAITGITDVLDHFLAMETPETGHLLSPDIVFYACVCKKVDVLDRLFAKGYSVNEVYNRDSFVASAPIYRSFSHGHDRTDVLDRLIMQGADVNVDFNGKYSVLYEAVMCDAKKCAQRLFDVGARVKNDTDVRSFFTSPHLLTRRNFDFLVAAGMDLNYRTYEGTCTEIVTLQYHGEERERYLTWIREAGGQ